MCKEKMIETTSYLYLIPAHFRESHEESAEYYLNNAVRIDSMEQIPAGNRACHMYLFQCPNCGNRVVSVVDFLKVRENELVEGGDVYPYEEFREFFCNKERFATGMVKR